VVIKGDHLPIQDVVRISSSSNCHVALSHDADEAIAAAYQLVVDSLSKGKAMYGINTNFGGLATEQLSQEECAALQVIHLPWMIESIRL
jgi:histidine ammonia-lyase